MKPARFLRFALKLPTHRFTGVDLILTRKCNLACRYCGVIRAEKKEELSPGQWLRIMDYFAENRHVHFIFTGGEPLLYPSLPELIAYGSRTSMTCLLSNGKALTPEVLAEMPNLDFLTLSVDPEMQDSDSGKHGFDRLEMLHEQSRRTGLSVSVMATVTRRNIHLVPDLVRSLRPYGFPFLLSLYHGGSGHYDFRRHQDELEFQTTVDIDALGELAEELIRLRREGHSIGETDVFLRSLKRFKLGQTVTDCRAGSDWFEVDCDGSIKACHDAHPSSLNALDRPDYRELRRVLPQTRPEGCRCVYDFYFNARSLKTNPVRYLWHVWHTRNLVSRRKP